MNNPKVIDTVLGPMFYGYPEYAFDLYDSGTIVVDTKMGGDWDPTSLVPEESIELTKFISKHRQIILSLASTYIRIIEKVGPFKLLSDLFCELEIKTESDQWFIRHPEITITVDQNAEFIAVVEIDRNIPVD